jgi:ATP-dependent RNA helicase HelY
LLLEQGALRASFVAKVGFELDQFQLRAIDALDEGHSVVVAAPTGSGKTLVAEYAVELALASGGKAFYTTPLKALSNQKYADFCRRYGPSGVGLLTGDNSINAEAPVVVMTTEVLRNMIYAGSSTLEGLRYVVLDEVHYLQDPYRGPVWEEVIIHLAPEVDLVCLSATVSNAEELAAWVATVRGSTRAIIEERRPVPLHNLFLAGDRLHDELVMLPTLVDGNPNPRGAALTAGPVLGNAAWRTHRRSRLVVPRRAETVEMLQDEGLLPSIYFIFSRAGCDEAVRQCLARANRLTSNEQRRQVREIAENAARNLSDADLDALGYGSWLAGLEAGFAAHHAGMVPPFKEAVERCFASGLVQVVFATETLSLGINMPARSVVIEKLAKFGGERVEPLTPGEYTQLTGRAGRRGIDGEGYAVVLWSPNVSFEQVASLAGARTFTLTSSFRPTYNMATNLVGRCSPEQAHHLLNLSFAQYRADADIVRLERLIGRLKKEVALSSEAARCDRGDVFEYMRLERRHLPRSGRASTEDVVAAVEALKPGDVILLPPKRPASRQRSEAAVLSTSQRKGGVVGIRAVTAERRVLWLGPRDFRFPPAVLRRTCLPQPFAPRNRDFQRQVADALGSPTSEGGEREGGVASCPDLRAHLRAAARVAKLETDVTRLETQVAGRSESLGRQFDKVLGLLEGWGYVKGWSLSSAGERLARIYHPLDLLVAECTGRGLLASLTPAETAALVSVFTYEPRGPFQPEAAGAPMPTRRLAERWQAVQALAGELAASEELAGLPVTRTPDPGFAHLAYGWARGKDLASLVQDMSAGDFVRNVKQLIDLLRQLANVLPDQKSASASAKASAALFRGVVAASSAVGTDAQ